MDASESRRPRASVGPWWAELGPRVGACGTVYPLSSIILLVGRARAQEDLELVHSHC